MIHITHHINNISNSVPLSKLVTTAGLLGGIAATFNIMGVEALKNNINTMSDYDFNDLKSKRIYNIGRTFVTWIDYPQSILAGIIATKILPKKYGIICLAGFVGVPLALKSIIQISEVNGRVYRIAQSCDNVMRILAKMMNCTGAIGELHSKVKAKIPYNFWYAWSVLDAVSQTLSLFQEVKDTYDFFSSNSSDRFSWLALRRGIQD